MNQRALIVIDLQNDYFNGGRWPLHQIETAAANAADVLSLARESGDLVIHVRHEFLSDNPPFFTPETIGAQIHPSVIPQDDEVVIVKHQVNAFRETKLKTVLDDNDISEITIIGAMSHMCIDAAARSAADYGYQVTLIEDACATREVEFNGQVVEADDVHAAYMSALGFAYAHITEAQTYVSRN